MSDAGPQPPDARGPLADLRVIDLSTVLAGPNCARDRGAVGVWRHASSRGPGRPRSTNRAKAAVRRSRSHAGSLAA